MDSKPFISEDIDRPILGQLPSSARSEDSEDNSCPICCESFDTADKISCGQCKKEMCVYCSSKWTKTCPFCNKEKIIINIERENPQPIIRENNEIDRVCFRKVCELICILLIVFSFYFFYFKPIILNDPDNEKKQDSLQNITKLINSTKVVSSTLHKLSTHLSH